MWILCKDAIACGPLSETILIRLHKFDVMKRSMRTKEMCTEGKEAHERDLASCAMIVDCVRNGADIVRMHNTEMAQEVVSVADALHRTRHLPS